MRRQRCNKECSKTAETVAAAKERGLKEADSVAAASCFLHLIAKGRRLISACRLPTLASKVHYNDSFLLRPFPIHDISNYPSAIMR